MSAQLGAERELWRIVVEAMRRAPARDAQNLADEIRAELDAVFPSRRRA